MNWLQKLVSKVFSVKSPKPAPFDRPAKSVAFEAKGQKVVDTVKVNTPWEDAAETIRNNRMFSNIPPQQPRMAVPKSSLRPIDVIGHLPPDTTVEQYLARHKNPEQGDAVFIGNELWAWGVNGWVLINNLPGGVQKDKPVIRHPRPSMSSRGSRSYDNGPLLDTLIITQAVTDDAPSSSSRTRQDSHRYEDSLSHTPSSHSHSRDHDHSRDDSGNYDSGGSDTSGSSD